jgi:hypothetical protein
LESGARGGARDKRQETWQRRRRSGVLQPGVAPAHHAGRTRTGSDRYRCSVFLPSPLLDLVWSSGRAPSAIGTSSLSLAIHPRRDSEAGPPGGFRRSRPVWYPGAVRPRSCKGRRSEGQ